jgi:hypothetical protein
MKIIEAKITKRGRGVYDRNEYLLRTDEPPSKDLLFRVQDELGFAVQGYGSPTEINTKDDGFEYTTTWKSFASSE